MAYYLSDSLSFYITTIANHVIRVSLPSQSESEKHNQEKKPTNLCAPRELLQWCVCCLIIIQSLPSFTIMFSLYDLRFVFCSRDLDVLRAQRIMGFFICITHKSTRSEKPITCTVHKTNECLNVFIEHCNFYLPRLCCTLLVKHWMMMR